MAGIIAFFMGIGSFFQFGQAPTPQSTNLTTQQSTTSAAKIDDYAKKYENIYKEGARPFFGEVIEVKKSEIIIEVTTNMNTANTTNEKSRLNIKIDNSTSFIGGKQSDITKSSKVAGIGK